LRSVEIFERIEDIKAAQQAVPPDAEDRDQQLYTLQGRGEELYLMLEDALIEESKQ